MAAIIAVVLVLATTISTWQAVRAKRAERQFARERDQAQTEKYRADQQAAIAQAVNRFLNEDVLGQANPYAQANLKMPADPDLKVRDALDRAARRIAGRFKDQPLVEAATREQIGDAYLGLGQDAAAEEQFQFALRLRQQVLGEQHPDSLRTLHRLALASRRGRGVELLSQVLETQRKVLGEQNRDTLDTMADLAGFYSAAGEYSKAEPLFLRVVEAKGKVLGEGDLERLYCEYDLAAVQSHIDPRPMAQAGSKARQLLLQILDEERKAYPEQDPRTLGTLKALAESYHSTTEYDKALPLLSQAVEGMRKSLGPQHPQTLHAIAALADVYQNLDQFAKAEPMLRELSEWCQQQPGERTATAMIVVPRLIQCYSDLKQPDKKALWEQNLRLFLEARLAASTEEINRASAEHRLSDYALAARASLYQRLARFPEAIADHTRCIALDPNNLHAWGEVAYLQLYLGDEVAYAATRARILRRFGDTTDLWHAAMVARPCLMAGGTVPAAVIIIGKAREKYAAASITAL